MKRSILAIVAVFLAGAAITSSGARAAGGASSTSFTAAQATAGAAAYAKNCSVCHGANLEGVSAPALRGDGSGLANDTVGEAWTFISTQMPAGNPGSLRSIDYTNIVAYILKRNGHAAGKATLTPAIAKSSKTKV